MVWPVLHISLLVMKRLNLTEPVIFISSVNSLIPNDLTIFRTYWIKQVSDKKICISLYLCQLLFCRRHYKIKFDIDPGYIV